ncbi:MAG: AsmA family protein [Nitrosospira multiformis]|nr:AsmA family protein [Nitrosospira multiformis]
MSVRTRQILSVSGTAFLLLVIAFIIWFDWNMLKPYIERQVAEKTGREFTIRGDLDVNLSLHPLVSVEGLSLANAAWGTEQPMVTVDRVAARISLWDLLFGNIVLPEISITRPWVLLEKSMDGRRNWDLKKEEKKKMELPEIGQFTLDQGKVLFRDPKTKTDIAADVFTDPAVDARELPLHVAAEGKFTDLKFTARVQGGKIMSLADKAVPYPIKASVEVGTTRASAGGTIKGLAEMTEVDLKLDLHGEDLSALYPVTGIVIFPSPPYHISGRVLHHDTEWSMKGFSGKVGNSDLGGDIVFDTGGERPLLRGDVVSKVLDLSDLQGFIGARRGPQPQDTPAEKQKKKASAKAQKGRILPDKEFGVEGLQAMDADLKFRGESIRNQELPVEHLVSHLKVDNGLLTLAPANFAVAGGNIISNITINTRPEVPRGEIKVDVKRLQLPKLFPKLEITKNSAGVIGGAINIKSHGKSVGALLGSADGDFGLIMSGGQISKLLLEVIGLDGGQIIKLLFAGDKNVPVRCGVIDFGIKEGIMSSKAFVIDTPDTKIVAEGQISLAEEKIDMKLSPQAKDVSILSLRTPIHLEGTFKDPVILPDKILAMRAGAAVLLGVLATPLAALIPTIETGLAKDANCRALIASVETPAKRAAGVKDKRDGDHPKAVKPK